MAKLPYKLFFQTLGNKVRLEIIYALRDGSKNVSELTKKLPYKQSTISHNLKRLITCQFISVQRKGLYHFYSLNKETMVPLLKLMDQHINKYCKQLCP